MALTILLGGCCFFPIPVDEDEHERGERHERERGRPERHGPEVDEVDPPSEGS